MALDPRFTLLVFPQHIKGDQLTLNLVFLPRNFSPLQKVPVGFPTTDPLPPFAEAKPKFVIRMIGDATEFPGKLAPTDSRSLNAVTYSSIATSLYKKLKDAKDEHNQPKYFDIDETRSSGVDNLAPKPSQREDFIKKYLPQSYRESFNFTTPRTPNAVTDDSYHCAIRDNKPNPLFKPTDGKVSWGKVYAHLMRQPMMAVAGGLIYQHITITVDPVFFKKGGWIWAELEAGDYFKAEQDCPAAETFIKKYGAKIPPIPANPDTALFAAVLFPVMKLNATPVGVYDDLFIEAGRYNDGFAEIIHASQPVSANLLNEEPDGMHPQKEAGIRLGWDDEQILIWYMRQLMGDKTVPAATPGQFERLDLALGVTGYHIDVKDETEPGADWQSLNAVQSKLPLALEEIPLGDFKGELPYQVYPVQLQGEQGNYWLPMYYLNWNEHSVMLPDKAGAEIFRHAENVQTDKDGKRLNNTPADIYDAPDLTTKLRYGHRYSFKTRLCDMSGGTPSYKLMPKPKGPAVTASIDFKRYIAPNKLGMESNPINTHTDDANFDGDQLVMSRPLLGYPAVVYTGKYTDPVTELKAASIALAGKDIIGIPDPDVAKVEIVVEVETMQMDNLLSKTGKENYIRLYTTTRNFSVADLKENLEIPLEFKDFNVLHLHDYGNTSLPFDEAADNDTITADTGKIILPTNRNIRITVRAVAEGPDSYFGQLNADTDKDCRYGKTTQLKMRRVSKVETALFSNLADPQFMQGIYLQPDPVIVKSTTLTPQAIQPAADGMPTLIQRLGKQIGMEAKTDTTLTSPNGQRVQFVCSSHIRHTLAPDNSSITFASTQELLHHWLVCTELIINRDWSWDGLEAVSFAVKKLTFLQKNAPGEGEELNWTKGENLPDIELKRAISFNNQMPGEDGLVHREYTKIIYIDAVDTKPPKDALPDELEVFYQFWPRFKNAAGLTEAEPTLETTKLELPTTINPFGIPKLIGAGVALSPYNRNKKYSSTEARRRYLWLEFESAPENPDDGLFGRVLAYAPDQLLSNNHPSLYEVPKEPPLPIDPEYLRVITTESSREHNGLNAMQKLKKSVDDEGRYFYLLPIPAGMHPESPELFGFFTYEFRFGHTDKLWSTAQGRFGRPLRVTGLQHPAPTLTCTVDRDDKQVKVSAPYAQAVADGRNVTSNPPRTSLWCLLYAQVKQADGLDYRNVLLDQKKLNQRSFEDIQKDIEIEWQGKPVKGQTGILVQQLSMHKVLYKEAVRYGEARWTNTDIAEMLYLYGLPGDASLSVLCVEVFGTITNLAEHISDFASVQKEVVQEMTELYDTAGRNEALRMAKEYPAIQAKPNTSQPLGDELGFHRILRTSPLAEVPFVCCADC